MRIGQANLAPDRLPWTASLKTLICERLPFDVLKHEAASPLQSIHRLRRNSANTMAQPADTSSTPRPTESPTPVSSFPRLPLTTTFAPPRPDCTGIHSLPATSGYWWAVYGTQASCLPSDYTADPGNFFYSPGVACPSGYQTACYDSAGFSSITTVTW
jgi:hypothetical protein